MFGCKVSVLFLLHTINRNNNFVNLLPDDGALPLRGEGNLLKEY